MTMKLRDWDSIGRTYQERMKGLENENMILKDKNEILQVCRFSNTTRTIRYNYRCSIFSSLAVCKWYLNTEFLETDKAWKVCCHTLVNYVVYSAATNKRGPRFAQSEKTHSWEPGKVPSDWNGGIGTSGILLLTNFGDWIHVFLLETYLVASNTRIFLSNIMFLSDVWFQP